MGLQLCSGLHGVLHVIQHEGGNCRNGKDAAHLKKHAQNAHIPVYITDPLLKEIYKKAEIAALPEHLRNHYINLSCQETMN